MFGAPLALETNRRRQPAFRGLVNVSHSGLAGQAPTPKFMWMMAVDSTSESSG